ncbi:MAG: hypothetical protein U0R80_07745 [Nocardioidaceae bacterium]
MPALRPLLLPLAVVTAQVVIAVLALTLLETRTLTWSWLLVPAVGLTAYVQPWAGLAALAGCLAVQVTVALAVPALVLPVLGLVVGGLAVALGIAVRPRDARAAG